MEISALKEIGLSDGEIKTYLELIKHDETLVSELAERTGINRTMTYQILNNLLKRGFVSYVIKNNVKYFRASNPSRILEFLKEKELNIQKLLPDLLKVSSKTEKKYNIEVYEGKEGLKTIMNDILKSKTEEWMDFTSGLTIDILPDFFMDKWERERYKARIKAKFLINNNLEGRRRGIQLSKLKLSEVRYLPKEFRSPAHIYVYGNKVGIALWVRDFPFGILIESKEIVIRFKEFFEWFWKIAKK